MRHLSLCSSRERQVAKGVSNSFGEQGRCAERFQRGLDRRSRDDGPLSYWPFNNSRRFFASRFPIPLRDTNVAKCFPLGLVLPLSQL